VASDLPLAPDIFLQRYDATAYDVLANRYENKASALAAPTPRAISPIRTDVKRCMILPISILFCRGLNSHGPAGMRNRRHTTSHRAPPALTLAHQEELRATLAAAVARGERWTGSDVATWISERLGRLVAYSLGYAYLKRLKHSQQLPRPHHVQADPVAQQRFKKR
jgi:transposase